MRVLTAGVLMATGALLTPGSSLAANQESLQTPTASVPSTCPVTKSSDRPFVPPAPYPSTGALWIGNEQLWTNISADGIWSGLPHYTPEDSRFRQKLFWWHEGYDWRNENPPELKVTGARLDAPAPPIETDEHANAGWTNDRVHAFMVVGIFIPTVAYITNQLLRTLPAIAKEENGGQTTVILDMQHPERDEPHPPRSEVSAATGPQPHEAGAV